LIDYEYVMLHVSLSTFLHIAVQLNELLIKVNLETMPASCVTILEFWEGQSFIKDSQQSFDSSSATPFS